MKKRVNPLTVVETLRKVVSSSQVAQHTFVVIVPANVGLQCDIMCGSNCDIWSLCQTLCLQHPSLTTSQPSFVSASLIRN